MYDGLLSEIRYPWGLIPFAQWIGYDPGHVLAPVRYALVSWYARHVERPPSPHPVLAGRHAGPVSGSENLGGAGSLDAVSDHRVALPSLVGCRLLGCSYAGGVVGPGSAQHLATAPRWHPLSGGRWQ